MCEFSSEHSVTQTGLTDASALGSDSEYFSSISRMKDDVETDDG